MQNLLNIINNAFAGKNVLVMGDLMVDEYVTGKVRRISPEAPVPVLNFDKIERSAGGASNVVRNVRSLGANVWSVGIAAEDKSGEWLRENLKGVKVDTEGIVPDSGRPTITKTRYATKGQQLLRVDNEVCGDIAPETKEKILDFLKRRIGELDAVILSDYCKGIFEDGEFVKAIIAICRENNVFISIDSKSRNIENFSGASFVKPNNLELEAAVGVEIVDEDSLNRAGTIYLEKSGIERLVVTRGASGISVFEPGKGRQDFAASRKAQVFDVTGAGDTVISTATMALISGASLEEAMYLANVAAGIVISKVGTVAITGEELAEAINE